MTFILFSLVNGIFGIWLRVPVDYINRDYINRDYINRDYINRDYINRDYIKQLSLNCGRNCVHNSMLWN